MLSEESKYSNYRLHLKAMHVDELKKRTKDLKVKLDILTEKNYAFLKLVMATDGNLDKVPNVIINKQHLVDESSIWVFRNMPRLYPGNKYIDFKGFEDELVKYEAIYEYSLIAYGEVLDELTKLYERKNAIIGNEYDNDESKNYKLEALKVINIFSLYGVIDDGLIVFDVGIGVNFEKREEDCVNNLFTVVDSLMPTDVNVMDYYKIKDQLSKLGRIRILSEKEKEEVYSGIENYIAELADRKSHTK